jgi:hypothetical protein
MPALPVLSGCKTVRVFERLGWQVARQRGSHIVMVINYSKDLLVSYSDFLNLCCTWNERRATHFHLETQRPQTIAMIKFKIVSIGPRK